MCVMPENLVHSSILCHPPPAQPYHNHRQLVQERTLSKANRRQLSEAVRLAGEGWVRHALERDDLDQKQVDKADAGGAGRARSGVRAARCVQSFALATFILNMDCDPRSSSIRQPLSVHRARFPVSHSSEAMGFQNHKLLPGQLYAARRTLGILYEQTVAQASLVSQLFRDL